VALGQPTEATASPDGGVGGGRGDQPVAQAELPAQVDGLGHSGQEGVRAGLDRDTGQVVRADLASRAVTGLDQGDLGAGRLQVEGGGQPGDAATDDGDPQSLRQP
jgi:hypothetical protein